MATVATDPTVETSPPPESAPFGLSAEAFLRGVERDLFPTDRRIFLWDGRLYEKMAKKLAHAVTGEKVRSALVDALPPGWELWGENPILADEFTAPLPDLSVIRGKLDDYFERQSVPTLNEIGLVIELAESSLREDRTRTLAKYAAAGLPVYWLINLVDWRVEVYSNPRVEAGRASYADHAVYAPGEDAPLVLDGVAVARVPVSAILPGAKPR